MDDFFTPASLATLIGSVAAVTIIVNTIRHALNWGPRWFILVLSIAIAFIALVVSQGLGDQSQTIQLGWLRYIIVLINGCLIYTSAFGIQSNVIVERDEVSGLEFQGAADETRLSFRSPW